MWSVFVHPGDPMSDHPGNADSVYSQSNLGKNTDRRKQGCDFSALTFTFSKATTFPSDKSFSLMALSHFNSNHLHVCIS